MMVAVNYSRPAADMTASSSVDACSRRLGFVKLDRSFPEEKFPPFPLTTINLMVGSSLAYLTRFMNVSYMSLLKALKRAGLLKVM